MDMAQMMTSASGVQAPVSVPARDSGGARARLGKVLLASWVVLTGMRFWLRLARPRLRWHLRLRDSRMVHEAEHWFEAAAAGSRGVARATVVLVPAIGCPCEHPPVAAFCKLAQRWQPRGMRFVIGDRSTTTASISNEGGGRIVTIATAPKLPQGMNLLVFGRNGRLLFGGPLSLESVHDDMGGGAAFGAGARSDSPQRGGPSSIVELLLDRISDGATAGPAPMLLRPNCDCLH